MPYIVPSTGGGGGGASLDQITAAVGAASIANGNNQIDWLWQLTANGQEAFRFGESAASTGGTGTQRILHAQTAAGSTADPFVVTTRNVVRFDATRTGRLAFSAAESHGIRTISANANFDADTDCVVLVDTSGGNVTLTLPATPADGQLATAKKITTDSNVMTVARNGNNIEGAAANLAFNAADRPSVTLQFRTGTGWWIV